MSVNFYPAHARAIFRGLGVFKKRLNGEDGKPLTLLTALAGSLYSHLYGPMITNTGSCGGVRLSAPALVWSACSLVNCKSASCSVSLDCLVASQLSFFFIKSVSFGLNFVVFQSASLRPSVKAEVGDENYHRGSEQQRNEEEGGSARPAVVNTCRQPSGYVS